MIHSRKIVDQNMNDFIACFGIFFCLLLGGLVLLWLGSYCRKRDLNARASTAAWMSCAQSIFDEANRQDVMLSMDEVKQKMKERGFDVE